MCLGKGLIRSIKIKMTHHKNVVSFYDKINNRYIPLRDFPF